MKKGDFCILSPVFYISFPFGMTAAERRLARDEEWGALTEKIGYRFRDPALFREALTHKSFSNEQTGSPVPHNERLEFLGDAVLDLAISQIIFRAFPAQPEGELTRIRAEVVQEKSLAALGRGLDLGACLRLGKGEAKSGGHDKDSLIADALEALLGAIFIDGGFEAALDIIEKLFSASVTQSARRKFGVDYKTRLQELLQARHGHPPVYSLTKTEGPEHQRLYTVEVRFDDRTIGRGQGKNKKGAEQQAAREALTLLGE
jgi:ribonuclease-3